MKKLLESKTHPSKGLTVRKTGGLIHALFGFTALFSVFSAPQERAVGQILLPSDVPPVKVVPPNYVPKKEEGKEKESDYVKDRKQKIRDSMKPPKKSASEIRNEQLDAQKFDPIQGKFHLGINWLVPTIETSGAREDYRIDPTTSFFAYHNLSSLDKETVWYWGLRVLGISGSGIYNKIPGQFGFLYFGPSFGVAFLPSKTKYANNRVKKSADTPRLGVQFIHAGLSIQTRRAGEDNNPVISEDDMTTTDGVNFDGSGFWMEYQYQNIYYGKFGYGYVAGFQFGDGKTFYWLGVSTVGWG